MIRLLRWLLYLICGLATAVVLVVTLSAAWMYASLPNTKGDVETAGLSAPVDILRDSNGLVTIQAQNLEDGAYGLGYVHAQERLTQMELMRRIGRGQLSEVIGKAGVASDRLMRTLGFGRQSDRAITYLEQDTLSLLQAYADGVNAFLQQGSSPLPLEMALLGIEPEPWEPSDSVLWGKMMAIQLSGNWRQELRNARLDSVLTPDQMRTLFPDLPSDSPSTLDTVNRTQKNPLALLLEALPEEIQAYRGASNVWALSGERTDTGYPFLANDPHLSLQAPGTWFLARIETQDETLAGATAPGVPLVVIGHNGQAAWGITTTHSDTQDLILETLDTEDQDSYQTPNGSRSFDMRQETLPVRFGEDIELQIREGRFGPVVSDVSTGTTIPGVDQETVATLAWPVLRAKDTTADSLVRLNRATSWSDFEAAMRRFVGPQQNIFYADRSGTIGFYTPGLVPIRNDYDGSRPVHGKDREEIWTDFIPFEELPHARDPRSGQLLNANNRIAGPDYSHHLGTEWPEPYRAMRISDELSRQSQHGLQGMAELQNDSHSLMALELIPLMLDFESDNVLQESAKELLSSWNGKMSRDASAPLVFQAWLKTLQERLFEDSLSPHFQEMRGWNPRAVKTVLKEERDWCRSLETSCKTILQESLATALALLKIDKPGDFKEKTWGNYHRTQMDHPLYGRLPLLGRLFSINLATDGGDFTVNRGTPSTRENSLFRHVHGPGLRTVLVLEDLDNSLFMIATGQSGNPLSVLFSNFAEPWRDGQYVKLAAPELDQADVLRLTPQPTE
ncbi:penicillin acylase family protein [Fodinicurvata sediminis]|uniref:penicillin acylase family protein n=1 Tax=Fodinicurvata sediminis TaxID=1121832 RepID=UPI000412DEAF|nr:penicillin acylase family protein [Fodinicurvata sediminis]